MPLLIVPAIWLLILIIGLPQLSETMYTPSLPKIGLYLQASEEMMGYLLTVSFIGLAIGTLFWGYLSDKIGRKPCVISGLILFAISSFLCYMSSSIEMLIVSKFILSLSGSIGSVLVQAMCRDAFEGKELAKAFSSVGTALALFPAIGPILGGIIAQKYGWESIFILLIAITIPLIILVQLKLPETSDPNDPEKFSFSQITKKILVDKRALAFGLIVGGANGILFSYFSGGSFYLITELGLTRSQYGFSFLFVTLGTLTGGTLSKKLQQTVDSIEIMNYGLRSIAISSFLFTAIIFIHKAMFALSQNFIITIVIACIMVIAGGICMAANNALAIALTKYRHSIGAASSIFGFFYNGLISLFTLILGYLPNGTLFIMPLYFLSISIILLAVEKSFLRKPRV